MLTRAHVVVAAVVTVVALVGTGVVLLTAQPRTESVPLAAGTATPSGRAAAAAAAAASPSGQLSAQTTVTSSGSPVDSGPRHVVVHVAGDVRKPGVVTLAAGARVVDAIDAAGGARRSADLSTVNLARPLVDGEQVRVGLPPAVSQQPTLPEAEPAGSAVVDLNAAGITDLQTLPGIGPVLAERIVSYRDQSGPFRSVDQLREVSGIGPTMMADLRDLVRV
jgi:competence protein ComEA